MSDKEMEEFLDDVIGVVEANSFEQLMLWQENNREDKRPWADCLLGHCRIVGHVGDMPVCLSLSTAKVGGHKLLFIDPTSQVVDHRMIDNWLEDNLPKTAFREDGYINRTNAMNFYNVFPR